MMNCIAFLVYPGKVVIDTDLHKINATNIAGDVHGTLGSRTFTDGNNFKWSYEISILALSQDHAALFAHGNYVTVRGSRPLVIKSNINLVINTTIDISAVPVLGKDVPSHLGGYSLDMKNCCYVGKNKDE